MGEFLLTIMSSLSQEESRSISKNVKWGQRKRFADGKCSVSFSHFLGYDQDAEENWVINEEEAETVREIFRLFLEGLSGKAIANRLTEEGSPRRAGRRTGTRGRSTGCSKTKGIRYQYNQTMAFMT